MKGAGTSTQGEEVHREASDSDPLAALSKRLYRSFYSKSYFIITMVLYVWLIAYHATSRRRSPSHWAIFVTRREDGLKGDIYHAVGSPFQGYDPEVKLGYKLEDTRRQYTRIFLGRIDEGWNQYLRQIAGSIPCPGISPTPLDPFAVGAPRTR
jgi:hypothetical protein